MSGGTSPDAKGPGESPGPPKKRRSFASALKIWTAAKNESTT